MTIEEMLLTEQERRELRDDLRRIAEQRRRGEAEAAGLVLS
jgi:hypothetical protein